MEERSTETTTVTQGEAWARSGCGWFLGFVVLSWIASQNPGWEAAAFLLLLLAIASPFFGMKFSRGAIKGPCPYCESEVIVGDAVNAMDCPICKKRILVRTGSYHRVPP